MSDWLSALIAALLGGGLVQAISTLHKSIVEGRREKVLTDQLEIKTPLETESMALSNMAVSLQAAENRILAMERERHQDQEYYTAQIEGLQNRVLELQRIHQEALTEHSVAMITLQRKLDIAIREGHLISEELARLKEENRGSASG